MPQPEFVGETKSANDDPAVITDPCAKTDPSTKTDRVSKAVIVEGTGLRRVCLMGLGWICVILGIIGVVLPLLPTTPFLLVALWAFSHSSKRFHNWLYSHKFLGPMVQDWDRYRVVPLKGKILSVSMMSASLAYVAYKGVVPIWGVGVIGVGLLCVAIFILRCPSNRPSYLGVNSSKPELVHSKDSKN